MESIIQSIERLKLIPIVTMDDANHAAEFGDVLVRGGLPLVEITFRTPAAEKSIETLAGRGDLLVGAGTILSTELADRAIGAGAQFLVSPGTNPQVVEHVLKRGVPMVPGVATPSEIELALSCGVSTLKFFPAENMGGTGTLKSLSGPYANVRFVPTGGITRELLPSYLKLSSVLACGGSWVAPREFLGAGRFDAIAAFIEQARKLLTKP